MMRIIRTAAISFIMLVSASAAKAQLSERDRGEMEKMVKGDLYLRDFVPCHYKSNLMGKVRVEVVTEVTPSGVDWEKNLESIRENKKTIGVDIISWGFGPNDLIHHGELVYKDDAIDLRAEGAKPKNYEIWIRFIQIKNLDDFKKAFDQILSRKPLQDEHPEWPEDIRKAIASRRVIEGMTKAQAFCVIGTPIAAATHQKDGKKIETWFPRQDAGAMAVRRIISTETGLPVSLQFVDGILAGIVQKRTSVFAGDTVLVGNPQLSKRDKNEIKKMTAGNLYLRNNVPCRYVFPTPWPADGLEVVTVVTEVTPSGVYWERTLALLKHQKQESNIDTVYWGFGPNDLIRFGKLSFLRNTVELWAEGAEPKNHEIWIRFVQINNLDDFKKAFDQILSTRPLQDEHPEWPEEVRKAIAARSVIEGMTKAQAFCVVGTPVATVKEEEGGKKIETWFPRQDAGIPASLSKAISIETGFAYSLRFVDGILAAIEQKGKTVKVDLTN